MLVALIYAMTASGKSARPAPQPPVDGTVDARYHVQYLQQLLAIQASQMANINAIYGFMLPVLLFLIQFVATPIENSWVHWSVFAAYSALALMMLALVGMRRPELYTSDDPL